MALTDAEKDEIVFYLGYPANTLITGSLDYSSIIADRLTGYQDFTETRVKKYLKRIREIDTKIEAASERVSMSEVDGMKFNPGEVAALRGIKKSYIKELSTITGIPTACRGGVSVSL